MYIINHYMFKREFSATTELLATSWHVFNARVPFTATQSPSSHTTKCLCSTASVAHCLQLLTLSLRRQTNGKPCYYTGLCGQTDNSALLMRRGSAAPQINARRRTSTQAGNARSAIVIKHAEKNYYLILTTDSTHISMTVIHTVIALRV